MKHILSWKTWLVAVFLAASAGIYTLHYLIFHDLHHIFLYMIGDLAFLFIDILVVILFIEKLLERREKKSRLNKLNMVVGTFFSELGLELLRSFTAFVKNADTLKSKAAVGLDWTRAQFDQARRATQDFPYEVSAEPARLASLRSYLESKRSFMLSLLENPNILDHERFTDLLWAVFHLSEELSYRPEDMSGLPEMDLRHLGIDLRRAYSLIASEWVSYTQHLKESYPFLFSLAVRVNPLGSVPSAVVRTEAGAALP
ncbi:MAG: hypothetical protein A2Y69_09535 [Candidatus Aminicenantes bacterium RBG_13_59_9]|nr:MAG: hypothetical protein A2Y69_09535 [Candidatus Aminicenantes bacterium RBG_13_59_9]